MALDPIVWALKDAPVADAIERLVLAIYAEHADEDGCNAFPSYKTVADRAMTDRRTVIRRVQELQERGLLAEGDPAAAGAIPQRYRPKVYDVMIPLSWWGPSAVDRINAYRSGRGRPPVTSETRPAIDPAPDRQPRADAGRPREAGQECLTDTPADQAQGCLPVPARGDSQTLPGVGDRHPTLPYNPPQEPLPPAPGAGQADPAGLEPGQEEAEEGDAGSDPNGPGKVAVVAAELVASMPWPAGRAPDPSTRRRLAAAAADCMRRGHATEVVEETAVAGVDGARRPAAVVLTRLRELADVEPDPVDLAADAVAVARREREQLARRPHQYEPGRAVGLCRCGRPETASVHPSAPVVVREQCRHGRHPEGCPHCRTWTSAGPSPATATTGRLAGVPAPGHGLAAPDEALAKMSVAWRTGRADWRPIETAA